MDAAHIRNFSIIAHIDHGKTTLSDRLLHTHRHHRHARHVGPVARRDGSGARTRHHHQGASGHDALQARNGETYELNLIDTPGHVDFAYEVSRSLSACEGALLVVDAAQGVEAQTVANYHLAAKLNLTIIPVINKIDLPPRQRGAGQAAVGRSAGASRRIGDSVQRQGRHRHRGHSRSHRRARAAAQTDGRAELAGAGV